MFCKYVSERAWGGSEKAAEGDFGEENRTW